EDDRVGERRLDGQQRRTGEVELTLAVAADGSREPIVLEVVHGLAADDLLVEEERQRLIAEPEVAQPPEPPPLTRDHAEAAATGEAPTEQLEHAPAVRGSVAQRRIEHGQFVPIRHQRGRGSHDGYSTGGSAPRSRV